MKNNELILHLVPITMERKPITVEDIDATCFGEEIDSVKMDGDQVTLTFKQELTTVKRIRFFTSNSIKLESIEYPDSLDILKSRHSLDQSLSSNIPINKGLDILVENGTLLYAPNKKNGEIVIPEGVVTIGARVFKESSLKKVVLPSTLERIEEAAFYMAALTEIQLPEHLKYIGESAFSHSNLTSIQFPESIEQIDKDAFNWCYGLTEVVLPDNLKTLGDGAFMDCANLKSVVIGKGLENMGNGVFVQCTKLSKLKGKYVTGKGKIMVKDNVLIAVAGSFRNLEVPEGVIEIAPSTFESHSYLSKKAANFVVTLPSTIKKIGDRAFDGTRISVVNRFPESLEYLGEDAFDRVYFDDKEITLPASFKHYGCHCLHLLPLCPFSKTLTLKSLIPPTISEKEDFKDCPFNILNLPKKAKKEYEASDFVKKIKAIYIDRVKITYY